MKLYQSILILTAALLIPLGVDKARKSRDYKKKTSYRVCELCGSDNIKVYDEDYYCCECHEMNNL